ncbi:MAG: ATP-binding protein [Gemmatimonadetes bacterium]|nr:ATP-binding protein [Gemmatimonadota bacterium]
MSAQKSLRIATELDELHKVNAAIEALAEEENWSPDVTFQIGLAVEELGVNIVNYGHDDDKAHEIKIVISSEDETITIEIEDDGHAFNPLVDAPEPDLNAEVEDRTVGGLGIYLVRTMMDEVHYQRQQDKNCLTLVKRRDS